MFAHTKTFFICGRGPVFGFWFLIFLSFLYCFRLDRITNKLNLILIRLTYSIFNVLIYIVLTDFSLKVVRITVF